jgi:DNA-binding NarL/FixJ family response regulator
MRIAPAIALTNKEHRKLLALSRARQPMRLVQRAKIVLLAAKGLENREIAQRLGVGNDLFRGGGVAISPRV